MITAEQIRGARGILKWSARELAEKAGLSLPTIQRMEREGGIDGTLSRNVTAVQKTLEDAGIEFIPEDEKGFGVRLRRPQGR